MERSRTIEIRHRNPNPLLENLKQQREKLQSGEYIPSSPPKTALIIDGGGMAGKVGMDILLGLENSGMTEAFDLVFSTSSGSVNTPFFLGGEAYIGSKAYTEYLTNGSLIDMKRVRKVLDIDYLESVLRDMDPIPQERIRNSRSHWFIGVTSAATGEGEFLDTKDPKIDLFRAIKASCAVPILYNRPVSINGKEYYDGQIGCGLPVQKAIDMGAQDILVVLNVPIVERRRSINRLERILAHMYMRKYTPEFRRKHFARDETYNEGLGLINNSSTNSERVNIGVIYPDSERLSFLTVDPFKLQSTTLNVAKQVETLLV